MVTSAIEHRVNFMRGWSTLLTTAASVILVLEAPACLAFWRPGAYERVVAPTGTPGIICCTFFLAYLIVDSVVGVVFRAHFRRAMGAVYVHHGVVGIAVAAFLLPSPPRGFFPYVWGEVLTACRILPPGARWRARSAAFALRRVLWLFV